MANNIETVQKIYAAFGRGDIPAVMEHIADDLTLFAIIQDATPEIPWHARLTKKQDVPKFFQALQENVQFARFEPSAFAAAGDYVYTTISFDTTLKHNGKKLPPQTAFHRFTFKNGRVVEWRGTEDTALVRDAFRAPR